MAFSHTGSIHNSGTGSTASTGTHGLTINEGDLVVVGMNLNGNNSSTANQSGWTNPVNDEDPGSPTAVHALYWMVAGDSEPTSYTFALGSSDDWGLVMGVWTSDSDAVVDAAANTALTSTNTVTIVVNAVDGETISDNALSVIVGSKDWRNVAEAYTVVDNSYTGLVGNASDQIIAMAHRIFTTGETFSGDITIETADGDDQRSEISYSIHISFVESVTTASGTPSLPLVTSSGSASTFTPVTVTDVDTDETWNDGATGLVITGTGFV